MKIIGTITFHRANNFGAALQTYALKEYLKTNGYDCEIVDYRSPAIEERYKPVIITGSLKKRIRLILQRKLDKYRYRKFDIFRERFFEVSPTPEVDYSRYRALIVGSDQVWNMNLTKNDGIYFLESVPDDVKKISYAPSFGVDVLNNEQVKFCRGKIEKFDSLSIRETQGKRLLKQMTSKDITVVMDPVFLLDREEWFHKMQIKKSNKEYIFVYLFGYSTNSVSFINQLHENTGLPIYVIDGGVRRVIKEGKYFRVLSPDKWLELLANATYVITNSFHCTAFSIIFEKRLIEMPSQNGMGTESRIDNLLDICKMRDAVTPDISDFDRLKDFDWGQCEKTLNKKILESKEFLNTALMA